MVSIPRDPTVPTGRGLRRTRGATPASFGGHLGAALEEAGNDLLAVGADLRTARQNTTNTEAMVRARMDATTKATTFVQEALARGDTEEDTIAGLKGIMQETLDGLPEGVDDAGRNRILNELGGVMSSAGTRYLAAKNNKDIAAATDAFEESINSLATGLVSDPSLDRLTELIAQIDSDLSSYTDIPLTDREALKRDAVDTLTSGMILGGIEQDPVRTLDMLQKGAFDEGLKPQTKAQFIDRAQAEVKRRRAGVAAGTLDGKFALSQKKVDVHYNLHYSKLLESVEDPATRSALIADKVDTLYQGKIPTVIREDMRQWRTAEPDKQIELLLQARFLARRGIRTGVPSDLRDLGYLTEVLGPDVARETLDKMATTPPEVIDARKLNQRDLNTKLDDLFTAESLETPPTPEQRLLAGLLYNNFLSVNAAGSEQAADAMFTDHIRNHWGTTKVGARPTYLINTPESVYHAPSEALNETFLRDMAEEVGRLENRKVEMDEVEGEFALGPGKGAGLWYVLRKDPETNTWPMWMDERNQFVLWPPEALTGGNPLARAENFIAKRDEDKVNALRRERRIIETQTLRDARRKIKDATDRSLFVTNPELFKAQDPLEWLDSLRDEEVNEILEDQRRISEETSLPGP